MCIKEPVLGPFDQIIFLISSSFAPKSLPPALTVFSVGVTFEFKLLCLQSRAVSFRASLGQASYCTLPLSRLSNDRGLWYTHSLHIMQIVPDGRKRLVSIKVVGQARVGDVSSADG